MIPMHRYGLPALLLIAWASAPAQQEAGSTETDESPPAEETEGAPSEPAARDPRLIDLDELVRQVAERDGREFIIDPRVRGRAHIVPRAEQPGFESLLAVLRIHGFVAIASGERVYVMPDAVARMMPTRVLTADSEAIPDDEIVTKVVEVGVESAAQLVPVMRPMLPQQAHLAAVGNKLVIVDRYDNVRRIAEVARQLGQ